jgi:hypothetical protein
VPIGRQYADMGPWTTEWFYNNIQSAVKSLNSRIKTAKALGSLGSGQLENLYDPETVAWSVWSEFPPVVNLIETLEIRLHKSSLQRRYPGLIVAWRSPNWIYSHWALVIDLTKVVRNVRTSTVMIDEHYLGTDKLAHFIHVGLPYFTAYRRAINSGSTVEEALRAGARVGYGNNPIYSENLILGRATTGILSNADLMANYMGMKFFINLTEEARIRGRIQSPILVRDGDFWRFNDHVSPNSDFIEIYFSDHWDEALNPCTYNKLMRSVMRDEIQKRCDGLLMWYVDENGRRRSKEDFIALARELNSYYGEDYGSYKTFENIMTIGDICFDDEGQPIGSQDRHSGSVATAQGSKKGGPRGARLVGDSGDLGPRSGSFDDAALGRELRRSALHQAVRSGNLPAVRNLLHSHRQNLDLVDVDGDQPLHSAVRMGRNDIAAALLNSGANANARSLYGRTPLHLAAELSNPEILILMLDSSPDVLSRDEFGQTALHIAARFGGAAATDELIRAGAEVEASDAGGNTPLHIAARNGNKSVARVLIEAGASVDKRNRLNRTPADEAKESRSRGVLEILSGAASNP